MGFENYHPMINLLYFVMAILCAVLFNHPVFVAISWGCAFLYSVMRNGKKSLITNLILMVFSVFYTGWYSYYHHFGVTMLCVNFIGNAITLESVLYGFERGITIITVVMILTSVFSVVTSDKVVYLFGRISPGLSLFISILLRSLPRFYGQSKRIILARSGIGKSLSRGAIGRRAVNLIAVFSILITWICESFVESSASMKSRGYSLKGRTAYSIYRFDNRDRMVVLMLFFCYTTTVMAVMLNQTSIYYSPMIVWNRITPVSGIFYVLYTVSLLLPAILEIYGSIRTEAAIRHNVQE